MLPTLTPGQWFLAAVAALCIGLSKSGFAGVSMATVLILAQLFPPRESTGILLPLLICGDIGCVLVYRQHAQWHQIWRMLPPTILGVIAGYFLMRHIPDQRFSRVIGCIVLSMTALQIARRVRPALFQHVPHTAGFRWTMGMTSGVTTMLANAAGPVMALYFMAIELPKLAFVGTSAWFFLMVNVVKVPFSTGLGLISAGSLRFNLVLVPAVALGIALGRSLIAVVSQQVFEVLVLIFTTVASLRLIWGI